MTEALKKALTAQRVGGAEADGLEVIAKALGVPIDVVRRVVTAIGELRKSGVHPSAEEMTHGIPPEVQQAIGQAMYLGATRLILANAIRNAKPMSMPVSALLPIAEANRLCHGCPESIECLAQRLREPEDCYIGRKSFVEVFPVVMNKTEVTVEASQPLGRFTVKITNVR